MRVRAKFKVNSVTNYQNCSDICLSAVTNDTPENKTFWQHTPSGEMKLQVIKPETAAFFEPGQEYYLDFEKA